MKPTLKIIKIGGKIIDNAQKLSSALAVFAKMNGHKILVHGGGKAASKLALQMGIEVKMVAGRRITDQATLDVVTMLYAGKINKNIVAQLQKMDCNSIGLSGADGNAIVARKRPVKEVDFGFVGDVASINKKTINTLTNNNITPVFCAITHDKRGQLLNTNADTVASEIAIALAKENRVELFYLFEKNGVLQDIADENSVIKNITNKNYQNLIKKGVIADGMLPKLHNCMHAIKNGVEKIHIGHPTILNDENINHTTIFLK